MSEDNEELDSTTQPAEAVAETQETQEVEEAVVETESEDSSALEEKNKKLFERAKKAEAEVKVLRTQLKPAVKEVSAPQDTDSLPQKDLIAIIQAQVPVDDVDDVVEYAKLKKIPVAEALKTNVVKAILTEKAEERKTASATATGSQKRGTSKPSDETLFAKSQTGDLPESDEDMRKVVEMRLRANAGKKN